MAKDLTRKIFQVDPLKRIKFHEICYHPWLKDNIQNSINIFENNTKNTNKKINEELFQELLKREIDFHNYSEEKIREAIKKRKNYSFVVTYEMLNDEYIKKNGIKNNEGFLLINYSHFILLITFFNKLIKNLIKYFY